MSELEVPEGSMVDKNRGTEVVFSDGTTIGKGDEVHVEIQGDDVCMKVDGFHGHRGDAPVFVSLDCVNKEENGFLQMNVHWERLARLAG